MTEGLRGGVFGGEDERPRGEAPKADGSADAFAAALAAMASHQDPEVARKTVEFLTDQSELLKVKTKSVEAEHRFFEAEWAPRLLALRLRTGFQIFYALFATVIGAGLAIVMYAAVQSRSVVIDPFNAPPALAGSGLNGKVIASGLLDVLTRIQAANHASAEHRLLSNAWTNDIAIDVPDTGISIAQLERTLKTRFGHDQHIDGDLVQTDQGGLALTVRGNSILPKTFTGEARNLDKLLTEAGEYVYGQSQPGLWAAYLSNSDRSDEAIAFAHANYATVDPSERPYVLNYWANSIANKGAAGAMREALPLYRETIRLKPDFWIGYNNIMNGLAGIGDEEGVVRVGEQMIKAAGGRPGRAPENMYQNYDTTVWDLRAERAALMADMDSHGGIGSNGTAGGAESFSVGQLEVQLHDLEAAALRLKTTPIDQTSFPDVAAAALVRALLDEEVGDVKAAAHEWDTFATAYANPTVSTANPVLICFAALSYEKTGQPAKADAALRPTGETTFVDCYRFEGDALDLRGNWAGAQAWYAKAVTLAPSNPAGYYSWGVALARHGDLDGAAAKFKVANQKGPHWADPLKAWGDVLAQQGHAREALAKYDAALKFAPSWRQLVDARAATARK